MIRQFRESVLSFVDTAEKRYGEIFNVAVAEVKRSIVEGSEITGAPGQPVEDGDLKGSWTETRAGDNSSVRIWTWKPYAPKIEDATHEGRAMVLHSTTGGFHSVKLTVIGWPRIVANARAQVVGK